MNAPAAMRRGFLKGGAHAVTFSAKVKAEICRDLPSSRCCCTAMCYGMLLYGSVFTPREIRIISASDELFSFMPRLFRRTFGFGFDSISEKRTENARRSYVIRDPGKLSAICERFGYDPERMPVLHVNLGVLEEDHCRISFLKGAFLTGGSVTAPERGYHLEFATDHASVSRETHALLGELGFDAREASRKNINLLYFKQSAVIEDLLTLLGAGVSSMDLMSAKIEKGMMNTVNRKVNCDAANVKKSVDAAQAQLRAIRLIQEKSELTALPEKERETARLRLEHPSETTAELARLHDPPVSKSCVNHRLRNIMAAAAALEEKAT